MNRSNSRTSGFALASAALVSLLGGSGVHGQPVEPTRGASKELRIAVVCYGGISLAIYMHGITKEIHNLVIASEALDADAKAGFSPTEPGERGPGGNRIGRGTAGAFYDALVMLWREEGVRTRVVVDVLAGTSAGGINAVFLAKALAHDLPQDQLSDLWLGKASAWKLSNGGVPSIFRLVRGSAVFNGNAMARWLFEALAGMESADRGSSLMPPGYPLDLFVTTTDIEGRPQHVTGEDPATVLEKRHRHVFRFRYPGTRKRDCEAQRDDAFVSYWNPALTLAARATSSFPFAFPPANLQEVERQVERVRRTQKGPTANVATADEIASRFFPEYLLENPKRSPEWARDTHFMDGGVVDNSPFGPAIEELSRRSTRGEVRRILIYLNPDPGGEPQPPSGERPGLLKTIWSGLSGVPGSEPILEDLQRIAEHSERVSRVQDLIRQEEAEARKYRESPNAGGGEVCEGQDLPIEARVACLTKRVLEGDKSDWTKLTFARSSDLEAIAKLRETIEQEAQSASSSEADRAYRELRVYSVLEQFAGNLARRFDWPERSGHSALLQAVVLEWAKKAQLIGTDPNADRQACFLERFDIGYRRRRMKFVIDWLESQYRRDSSTLLAEERPNRAQLDQATAAVWARVDDLTELVRSDGGSVFEARVAEAFKDLSPWRNTSLSLKAQANEFVSSNHVKLDTLTDQIGEELFRQTRKIRKELFEDFTRITKDWPLAARREVLARYLGFAFWDRMLYPLTAFQNLGELDDVEVFRFSHIDFDETERRPELVGARWGHFKAFFTRPGRESDYLEGRHDGAERLLLVLAGAQRNQELLRPVLRSILDEEASAGRVRPSILAKKRKALH